MCCRHYLDYTRATTTSNVVLSNDVAECRQSLTDIRYRIGSLQSLLQTSRALTGRVMENVCTYLQRKSKVRPAILLCSGSPFAMRLALQWKSSLCISRKGIARTPNFLIHVLWAIYIFKGSVHIFSWSRTGRPIVGIYKSIIDTWM